MKYVIILGDGMADYPVQSLHGKTPLSVAKKPMMDALAKKGELGLVTTVPQGFTPGSDVANLGVLGYDVRECYTGRSPLEALSIGVRLGEDDLAIRTNLVTLSNEEDFFDKTMVDYSAGEITTEESEVLMKAVADEFDSDLVNFYSGTSYRNLLVLRGVGKEKAKDFSFTPPHDITGQPIKNHLPKGEMSEVLLDILVRSHQVLKNHPINQKRGLSGQNSANNLWFWGQGTAPHLDDFTSKYGVKGAVVSAVDLLKGIAVGAGMTAPEVAHATGNLTTNFEGKADTAISLLDTHDFVFVHLECTDECGHQKDVEGKIKGIELIDEKILTPIFNALDGKEDFKIMVLPDHPTPVSIGSHTADPVPYFIYDSRVEKEGDVYNEGTAKASGNHYLHPWDLTKKFFEV